MARQAEILRKQKGSRRGTRAKPSFRKEKRYAAKVCGRKDFGQFCDEWLLLSRSRVKESTYIKYRSVINKHLKPHFKRIRPRDLNTVSIEGFSHALLKNGLSAKTVRDILSVFNSILGHCRRSIGYGFPDIEIIYPKEHKKEMRVLTLDEQEIFTRYLMQDIDTVKFGVLLALLTGMRIGEICALKWQDISTNNKTVHIRSAMQRLQTLDSHSPRRTHVMIGETKSLSSNRIIPLTGHSLALCRAMDIRDASAFVLTGDPRRYLEPRALQYRFGKYTAACGLENVHFHTLRHTFATRCVEVGFDIKSLSEILGHSSAKVTLDRYVHSSLELKRKNMEKLAAVGL